MGIDQEKIQRSNTVIRAFDGSRKETIGMIHLPVEIGPYEFQVTFQVLDISAAYNMLLGRLWIHPAGAVPSTLHQNVKYAIDGLLVAVHGEQEFATFGKPSLPHISVGEETEPTSF